MYWKVVATQFRNLVIFLHLLSPSPILNPNLGPDPFVVYKLVVCVVCTGCKVR